MFLYFLNGEVGDQLSGRYSLVACRAAIAPLEHTTRAYKFTRALLCFVFCPLGDNPVPLALAQPCLSFIPYTLL